MATIETDTPGPVPVELPDRSMLVLFGSETGNSQDIADELGNTARRLHFQTRVEEMDQVELSMLLRHTLVIFVIPTTGQGDMPYNAREFWKSLLRKKLPPTCLSRMRFTTFGLGDSTYTQFNWASRKLHKRLVQLGGVEFYPRGEADEQHPDGIDTAYLPWATDLRTQLLASYPLPPGFSPIPEDTLLPPSYPLIILPETDEPSMGNLATSVAGGNKAGEVAAAPPATAPAKADVTSAPGPGPAQHGPSSAELTLADLRISNKPLPIPRGFDAVLRKNQRVTPVTHWQDVRHLVFEISPGAYGRLPVSPGDCITIYPKNFPDDVQKVIDLMGWEEVADRRLKLKSATLVPTGFWPYDDSTLRDILTHNLDIMSVPRRSFFKTMSHFTTNESHKSRLLEFSQSEFTDEYYDYATRPRRTILETLAEFTSVKFPVTRVLDVFPIIRGRDFSVANGGFSTHLATDKEMTRVELLVALVKYRTILRKPREGLCSRYIDSLPVNTLLRVTYKGTTSRLYGIVQAKRPLMAMATGTGISPIRALIWERDCFKHGDTFLFFGNRNRAADFFFQDEWDIMAKGLETAEPIDSEGKGKGPANRDAVFKVHTAFSRDQKEKVYVQDVIRGQVALVKRMIEEDAIFLVCGGSTRMADACKVAIKQCMRAAGLTTTEAEEDALFRKLTWWQEIW